MSTPVAVDGVSLLPPNCDKAYIDETSRMFKTRKEEHKEESDEASLKHYPRGNRKRSEKEFNK